MLGPHPPFGLGRSPTPLIFVPTAFPSFQRELPPEEEDDANLLWYTVYIVRNERNSAAALQKRPGSE